MEVEHILEYVIPYLTASLEFIGVIIVVYACVRALFRLVTTGFVLNNTDIKIDLAKGLAFSLEFKLAAEIIHSVTVRTIDEFIVLAAVVILRVILTFVIEWEIRSADNETKI